MIFDHAHRRGCVGKLIDGDHVRGWKKQYKFLFSMLGDDARMRVVREDAAEPIVLPHERTITALNDAKGRT